MVSVIGVAALHFNGFLYAPCGVFGEAFSPCPAFDGSPVTNFAKADLLRRCKPARLAHTACYSVFFISLSIKLSISLTGSNKGNTESLS